MYGIIYKAQNIINGKRYIGYTTKTLEERKIAHQVNSSYNIKGYFYNAIRKYGEDNFIWEEIDYAEYSKEELVYLEKYWIAFFYSNNPKYGYNMTSGGDGIPDYKHTNKAKKKISEAGKGRKHSEETKKKLSELKKGEKNPFYGKATWNKGKTGIYSEKILRKISETFRKEVNFNLIVDLYFKKDLVSINKVYQEYMKIANSNISYHCFRHRVYELGLKFTKFKKDKIKFIEDHKPENFYVEVGITKKKLNRGKTWRQR